METNNIERDKLIDNVDDWVERKPISFQKYYQLKLLESIGSLFERIAYEYSRHYDKDFVIAYNPELKLSFPTDIQIIYRNNNKEGFFLDGAMLFKGFREIQEMEDSEENKKRAIDIIQKVLNYMKLFDKDRDKLKEDYK